MVRREMTDRDRNEDASAAGQGSGAAQRPGRPEPDSPGSDTPQLESLARDWITLWQSEIAALAHDREAAETVSHLAAIWAGLAASWLRAVPPAYPSPSYPPPAHEPHAAAPSVAPGPASAAAAPDAGVAEIRDLLGELAKRLGGIERRLASLERGRNADQAGPGNRRRPGGPGGAGGTGKRRAKPAR